MVGGAPVGGHHHLLGTQGKAAGGLIPALESCAGIDRRSLGGPVCDDHYGSGRSTLSELVEIVADTCCLLVVLGVDDEVENAGPDRGHVRIGAGHLTPEI